MKTYFDAFEIKNGELSFIGNGDTIKTRSFAYNKEITRCIIPPKCTSVESAVFKYCTNIISIEILDFVEVIGSESFSHCDKLSEIVLPSKLRVIDSSLFEGCDSLLNITIPDFTEKIESSAFDN